MTATPIQWEREEGEIGWRARPPGFRLRVWRTDSTYESGWSWSVERRTRQAVTMLASGTVQREGYRAKRVAERVADVYSAVVYSPAMQPPAEPDPPPDCT